MNWRTIDTVPKDGNDVLLCDIRTDTMIVASWDDEKGAIDGYGWVLLDGGVRYRSNTWTHWDRPEAPVWPVVE